MIDKIKGWIDLCVSTHGNCSVSGTVDHTGSSFLPTRLVKVDSDQCHVVQLVSLTFPVSFLALTYCWGNSQQAKTTKANLTDRKRQIIVSTLAKTLQDALWMTRALGFEYIWIDSLCIVQDDEKDWELESSKMVDIYSGASLVLAATSASDCAEGFLHTRPRPLVIIPKDPAAKCPIVHARRSIIHAKDNGQLFMEKYPLYRRAWCMQERELARRVVHFLADEIIWNCRMATDCECGLSPTISPAESVSPYTVFTELEARKKAGETIPEFQFGQAWANVAEKFSSLNMTFITDTLPALSGLAKSVEYLDPGQYIAGIWERDISLLLSWRRAIPNDSRPISQRRAVPNGPTFSWIATSGSVRWDHHDTWEYSPELSMCSFVSAICEKTTANNYGHVKNCSISLRGRVIPGGSRLVMLLSRASKSQEPLLDVFMTLDDVDTRCFDYSTDEVHKQALLRILISDWDSVSCLGLHIGRNPHSYPAKYSSATALLLQRKQNDTIYKRIGLLQYVPVDWFDEYASEEIVTIV